MSQKTIQTILRNANLPKDRAAFIDAYDGDMTNIAGLVQDLGSIGDENPDVKAFLDAAMRDSSDPSTLVASLADSLYPQKSVGIRGKDSNVETKTESRVPENDPGKDTLPNPPADKTEKPARKPSVSPGIRKYAQEKGVDLSTVTGSGTNGTIKKSDIDSMVVTNQSADQMNARAAAMENARKPQAAPAADDMSDLPIPGAFGTTQADLNANAEPIPGAMGLTRNDVADYLDEVRTRMPMGSNTETGPAPTPMDMDRLSQAAAPSVQPASPPAPPPVDNSLSANDMDALIGQFYTAPQPQAQAALTGLIDDTNAPSAMDMSRLSQVASPVPQPSAMDMNRLSQSAPTSTTPKSGDGNPPDDKQPWSPVTSRADAFWKSMGMGAGAFGSNWLTKPADFALNNAIPIGIGAAAAGGIAAARSGPSGPSPEQMQQMEQRRDEARNRFQKQFGTFDEPSYSAPSQIAPPPKARRGVDM
jgi:hypothetical protein